jgi:hypothetical protein
MISSRCRTGIQVRRAQSARILSQRQFPEVGSLRTLTRRRFDYCPAAAEGASSEKKARLMQFGEVEAQLARRGGKAGAA